MAKFMFKGQYLQAGVQGTLREGFAAREAYIRQITQAAGGKVEAFYWAYGEDDVILIVDYPNNIAAAAFSVAASGGGAIKAIKTTPLISIEDGTEIMRMAAESGYSPPFEEIME